MARSILLADDSATIRKVVELTFSDTDFHVESVANGDEALERLARLEPDVVLADVVMPGATGYEVCRRVKASERPVPVLLLAGTFETFDAELARDCGADGHLMKPFESRALLQRVEDLLSRPAEDAAPAEPDETPGSVDAAAAPRAPVEEPREAETQPLDTEPDAAEAHELSPEAIDAIATAVLRRISSDVVREIALEVVPSVVERVVRERIRELEAEDSQ